MTSSPPEKEGLWTFASRYSRRRGAFGPKLARFSRRSAPICPVYIAIFLGFPLDEDRKICRQGNYLQKLEGASWTEIQPRHIMTGATVSQSGMLRFASRNHINAANYLFMTARASYSQSLKNPGSTGSRVQTNGEPYGKA